mgnify:FL=1
MKYLKHLLFLTLVLALVSCTVSAKNGGKPADNTAANSEGVVVTLDKTSFLMKVFNYEQNKSNFVYEGTKPCIVDFYADWCGPCRMVAPILKDLAGVYKDQIVVYKVNIDENKDLAEAFGIQSIPTYLFVPMKGKPQMAVGALPREEFVGVIENILLGKKQP